VRAFVTGGTGFLGRRIVRRLIERGDQVYMLARDPDKSAEARALGARIIEGDLADVDAFAHELRGCDVVYHAGARVVSHGEWEDFLKTTVVATEKLIDAALAAGVKRFVHVSSLGIFELDRDGMTVTESTDYDHNPRLRGNYTRSKIDADRIACAFARSGKPVVVVRPGRIYGHDHPQQPLFFGRVKKRVGNWLIVVSKPSYLTPIAYVENAADAVIAAGRRGRHLQCHRRPEPHPGTVLPCVARSRWLSATRAVHPGRHLRTRIARGRSHPSRAQTAALADRVSAAALRAQRPL
jgi:nucleoside-diphosphate-sugar epimerase